jgi:hypothetical protein
MPVAPRVKVIDTIVGGKRDFLIFPVRGQGPQPLTPVESENEVKPAVA